MVVVAKMALLLPGLSCKVMERPVTSWTPNSMMVTLSSTTLIVVLAKIASDSGENTCHKTIIDTVNKLGCLRAYPYQDQEFGTVFGISAGYIGSLHPRG